MAAIRRTSGDGSFLRSLNEVAVLRALRESGAPTLAELARAASLSRATTEVIMEVLQRAGWVVEAEAVAGGQRGRPARRYLFQASAAHVAGVAIGGSGVCAMVADLDGTVTGRAVEQLSPELAAAERLAAVRRALEHAAGMADLPLSRLAAVGVGTTGVIDNEGRVLKSVALSDWSGVEVQAELASRLRFRCWSRTTCGWRCWPSTGAAPPASTRTSSTSTPAGASASACCSAGSPTGAPTPRPANSAATRTAGGRRSSTSWTTRWPPIRAS